MRMAAAVASDVAATDEELLERLLGGDGSAFDLLYDRYYSRVFHFLNRRMRNRADVEETTQEVFYNLFSSLESFRHQGPFGAWVFGITRRTLANRFKKRRIESVSLPEEEMDAIPASQAVSSSIDPHEAYEYGERLERIAEAANELSPAQRRLFELHHIEFQSIEAIARLTQRSEDSVKSHLYRTRRLLLAR